MSVTIDSLDIQIRSSAGSAAKNIEDLAQALSKLNANAKVTKVINSLERLNSTLANMKSQTSTMSHLSALSKSLANLAAIPQLTGLRSAVNELKKLPAVMQSLDTAQITEFAAKIRLLAKGLGPLATEIDKIGKGFAKLPPQVSKCVTAVKRLDSANRSSSASVKEHGEAVNGASLNFLTAYENLSNVFSMMHGVQDAIAKMLQDSIQWDSVQARFGRAMGDSAEKYLAYIERLNEEMGINQQQFMGYSSLFADMMRGFGVGQGDAATMAIGFTELAYDIWAGTGDVFTTLEEAMDAVRSTIGGETESIQRAGFSVIESTLQETAARHNLAVNIEKATMAEKTYLRYLTLVDQAHARSYVGVYAAEMKTAEGAIRSLTQSLKTLSQAFGSLFIPILAAVIPYITAFVEILTDAVRYVAGLFGVELFKIDWRTPSAGMTDFAAGADSAASGLGNAADAAKKLKQYTMGFDELNIIDPGTDSAASGGAGGAGGAGGGGNALEGMDLDTLWDESVFAKASNQVAELKQKIKDFYDEWRWQIEAFGAGTMLMTLGKMVEKLKEADIFSGGFLKNMNTISKIGLSAVVITLQWSLMDQFLENFIQEGSWEEFIKAAVVAALGTWALGAMWGPAGVVIGLGITAAVSLKATFEDGSVDSLEEVITGITGLASAVGAAVMVLKKTDLGAALSLLFDGAKFSDVFAAWFPKTASITSTATTWVTTTMLPAMKTALTKLPTLLVNAVRAIPIWGWIVSAIVAMITLAVVDYDFTDIGEKFGHALGSVLKWVFDGFIFAGEWLTKLGMAMDKGMQALVDWVIDNFDINSVTDLIVLIFNPVAWIKEIVPKMVEIGNEVLPGLWQGFEDGWNNFWDNVEEFIDGFVQGFKDALGISSPSKVFAEIGQFIIEGLLNGISNKWNDVKKWFNDTVAPKFTKKYWADKWDTVRQATSDKLQEAKNTISQKWSDIKSWFSTNVAPKFTLNYWKTKFEVIKQAISSKLDEVKSAVSTKWGAIKTWFSANIAPKFTLSFWLTKFKTMKDGFTQTIKNMLNAGIDMLNQFIGWLNSKLKFSWDGLKIAGKEVYPGGSVQLLTIPKITQRFEDGGFIEDGLFTMNRGEIAGKFNNGKSVVANNQQIVEGIAAGVYEAVVAAMNATSGRQDQNINVYLDGKQITAAVEKRQSERGLSLMGNQLGYVY